MGNFAIIVSLVTGYSYPKCFASNDRSPKINQAKTNRAKRKKMNKFTTVVEGFNHPLSIIQRMNRQKDQQGYGRLEQHHQTT